MCPPGFIRDMFGLAFVDVYADASPLPCGRRCVQRLYIVRGFADAHCGGVTCRSGVGPPGYTHNVGTHHGVSARFHTGHVRGDIRGCVYGRTMVRPYRVNPTCSIYRAEFVYVSIHVGGDCLRISPPSACDSGHVWVPPCPGVSACSLRTPNMNLGRRTRSSHPRRPGCAYRYGPGTNGRG